MKDIIFIGVGITGAVVAVKGLGTWQRQLKGQSEYDLSRRLLVALFKIRDAINGVRNPMMLGHEIPIPSKDEAKKMSHDQISFFGTSKAYQSRWDKVQKERTNLYADLLEAEALWGLDLKNLFRTIYELEHELFTYIRLYLRVINPDDSERSRQAYEKILGNKRDIMYDDLGDEDDDYKKEFREGVEKIEEYLKPKLSSKTNRKIISILHHKKKGTIWACFQSFLEAVRNLPNLPCRLPS